MKYFSLILLVAFSFFAPPEEEIVWSEAYRLTWKDFKGTPRYNTSVVAMTASGISYDLSATIRSENDIVVDYKVVASFYPDHSWYNPDRVDAVVLAHEQLHFDITELHARKFRKHLSEMLFTENVKREIKAIYNQINKELKKMQELYDSESDFSMNAEDQKEWQEKIKDQLDKLDAYK
ncbi:DUF922 domain-containing protein [Leptobacterium sp. I13]|uniref:DUF922 domain-containing protein n=1 Tax=Leptobacterium meishanense TaxID=3128904 RepID=UPI0030EEBAED